MGVVERVRRSLNRVLVRLSRATAENPWSHELPRGWVRRQAVRFDDVDSLTRLREKLAAVDGPVGVQVQIGGKGLAFGDVVDRLAHASPAERRMFSLVGHRLDDSVGEAGARVFSLHFAAPSPTAGRGSTVVNVPDEARLGDQIRGLVDEYTREYTWRELRKNRPLVEPLSMEQALQNAYDRDVAHSAARVGALWGFVAGLVGSLLLEAILAMI